MYQADESDIDDVNLDPNIEIEMDESYDESSEVGDDDEIVFDEQYVGKDNTVWKFAPPNNRQTLKQNLLRMKPGPAKTTQMLSVRETFKFIFDQVMCNIIIKETNRKSKCTLSQWNTENPDKPQKLWNDLTEEEFDGYLGILITAGVNHSCSEDIKELWKSDAYPLYRATMAVNRFWAITRFLTFDNVLTRLENHAVYVSVPYVMSTLIQFQNVIPV